MELNDERDWKRYSFDRCPAMEYHRMLSFDDYMYIFGGFSLGGIARAGLVNYMFRINVGDGNVDMVEQLGHVPDSRIYFAFNRVNNYFYLYGGWTFSGKSNDLYEYNVYSSSWSIVNVGKMIPSIDGHTGEYVSKRFSIIYFGGAHEKKGISNDLYEYNFMNDDFEKISKKTRGITPRSRRDHGSTIVGNRDIYIFGGSDSKERNLNDIHILDTQKMKWSSPKVNGNIPSSRSSIDLCSIGKSIILFGGTTQWNIYSNETFFFNTITKTWIKKQETKTIPASCGYASTILNGKMYIHGGITTSSDIFELELNIGYKSYLQAIENGDSCPWGRAKLMVIGQGRVGKTSTIKTLTNQAFDFHEKSTIGANTSSKINVDNWNIDDNKNTETFHHAIRAAVQRYQNPFGLELDDDFLSTNIIKSIVYENDIPIENYDFQEEEEEEDDIQEDEDDDDLEIPSFGVIPEVVIDDENDDDVDFLLKEFDQETFDHALNRSGNDISFNIWDYGGQQVFHSLHQLFLTEYGISMICFAMDNVDLNELSYWYHTVKLHAPKSPIMFVGTRGDKIKKYKAIDKNLSSLINKNDPYIIRNNDNKLWFFPLDNTNGNGIDEIRSAIKNAIENESYVLQRVPLSWMKCLDKFESQDILSLNSAIDIAISCNVKQNDIETMLGFFHELGAIWHFSKGNKKLSKLVVSNPQWIIDAFTCLIFDDIHYDFKNMKIPAGLIEDFQQFRKDALLSHDLLAFLWKDYESEIPFLLELMQSLLLICKWNDDYWLLPCQLQSDYKDDKSWNLKVKWTSTIIKLPLDSIYQRLIIYCVRQWQKNGESIEPPKLGKIKSYFNFVDKMFQISWNDQGIFLESNDDKTTKLIDAMLKRIDKQTFQCKLKLFISK